MTSRLALRGTALFYLAALLVLPVGLILFRAFEKGLGPVIDALSTPQGMHAFWLTIIVVAIAVKVMFFGLTFAGVASLWIAVLADMGASLVVIANGLRLLRRPSCDHRAAAVNRG